MSLLRIPRNLSKRQLALFAAAWLVFFGVVGAILGRGGMTVAAAVCWIMAVAVPAAGCVFPHLLQAVYLGLAWAMFPLGFLLSTILLAVIYYGLLTPIGLVLRLRGHDPLARRWDKKAATYWCQREEPADTASYFRQF